MPDLVITPANVIASANAEIGDGVAGATIAAGNSLYVDPADNRVKLGDCDAADANARVFLGVALHGAAAGQPIRFIRGGDLTVGSVLTGGIPYFMSPNAGGICPIGDIAVGDDYVLIGIAASATVLRVRPIQSGFTRAV